MTLISFRSITFIGAILTILVVSSCANDDRPKMVESRFELLSPDSTGILFKNQLVEDTSYTIFQYRNYYNGGGVAIGDLTGNGFEDVFLTSNTGENKLYENLGNLKFKDITRKAGVAGAAPWSTGVVIADVNGDQLLDIYVCNSGDVSGSNKENELFVNQGNGTFQEKALAYGLNDAGYTTHATFFDYDHDGDLDAYILNNSFRPISTLGLRNLRLKRDTLGGDKLYRNDNGVFVDVSESAGIFGSVIGFGLGVTVGDLTGDGWEDLYVSNDFYERDYLYVNNQKGGFTEELTSRLDVISNFSMGADIADLDNDGYPEIFTTDMLPDSDIRLKQTTKFTTYTDYARRVGKGYHHQVMRNTLQHNRGDGTYREIGQMLGVAATDWSWGALMVDLDNNGYRDLFIANGAYKDLTNQDFINYMASDETIAAAKLGKEIDFSEFVKMIPSTKIPNRVFANSGNMSLADSSSSWGLASPSHSNGAAYADLDQDGDLDLVINNLNEQVSIYKNRTVEHGEDPAMRMTFLGSGKNTRSIGAAVTIFAGEQRIAYEHFPVKGFQSSSTYFPLVSVPSGTSIDSIVATDSYGGEIKMYYFSDNMSELSFDFSEKPFGNQASNKPGELKLKTECQLAIKDVTPSILKKPLIHTEDVFNDYDRDRLLYAMNSLSGPAIASGSLNGREDQLLFVGGAASDVAKLLIYSKEEQRYLPSRQVALHQDRGYEDVSALFIDIDSDGDEDLLVGSGGSEFIGNPKAYILRVYEHYQDRDGGVAFRKPRRQVLPTFYRSVDAIVSGDFNGDGFLDFATGGKLHPSGYGRNCPIAIYLNAGDGRFSLPVPPEKSFLQKGGLVTDMVSADTNGDGKDELVVVGEYMSVTILSSSEKGVLDQEEVIANSQGVWSSVYAVDLNGDGKDEIVGGNVGTNTFFSYPGAPPVHLYYADVDENGSEEHIYAVGEDVNNLVPLALKSELEAIIPSIKKKFVRYDEYADKTLTEIFDSEVLNSASHHVASEFRTCLFERSTSGWSKQALPWEIQSSPIRAIHSIDIDRDGDLDLIFGGNMPGGTSRLGPLVASRGEVLINHQGVLSSSQTVCNLNLAGTIVKMLTLAPVDGEPLLFVGRNSGSVQFLEVEE
ncbi:MAG: FG-GAP repeat domain-containing protein [Saprospiraceae bacterium]